MPKLCKSCKTYREQKEYYKSKQSKSGYESTCKPCRADKQRTRDRKMRRKLLKVMGDQCRFCGFTDWRALQVDHINGGGTKHRATFSTHRVYYNYVLKLTPAERSKEFQLLCANCNFIKRYDNNELN